MNTNALDKRLRALEDDFFRQVDLKLSEELRENTLRMKKRERLSNVMSIHDEATLDELIDYGINEETVAAVLLAPLVFVAWADGHVTDAERQTVIEIVSGYSHKDTAALVSVIEQWLDDKPSVELWDAWKSYIGTLRECSPGIATAMLSEKLLEHARRVAEASTSFLSFNRIAAEKQQALDQLRDVLENR